MSLRRSFVLLVIATLLVVACSAESSQPDVNPNPGPPLKIGWSLFPGWYPMAIAIDQDLFAKQGVVVEPVFYDIYSATFADIQAGKLDGALVTLGDALLMDGILPDSIRVVMVTDNSAGADAIVAAAEVATPADLKGKTIGTNLGSYGELFVINMLEANGLTSGDVSLINVDPETVPAALHDRIQAGHVWEPFITEALSQGYHVLFSSAETPGLIPDVLVIRTEVVEDRPHEVHAFIAAWFEAQQVWQTNPTQANAIIAGATGLNLEEISAEGVKLFGLEDNLRTFAPGTDITSLYASGQINARFLIASGGLSAAPDVNRLLDPSFLK